MIDEQVVQEMAARISEIKTAAFQLKALAGGSFPAVEKNSNRIIASVKMLELNVTDILDLT
jgi:hypothetical protein